MAKKKSPMVQGLKIRQDLSSIISRVSPPNNPFTVGPSQVVNIHEAFIVNVYGEQPKKILEILDWLLDNCLSFSCDDGMSINRLGGQFSGVIHDPKEAVLFKMRWVEGS